MTKTKLYLYYLCITPSYSAHSELKLKPFVPFSPNFPLHYFGDSDPLCNNNGQYLQLHTTKFNPISFQVSDIINYPTLGNFGSHEQ